MVLRQSRTSAVVMPAPLSPTVKACCAWFVRNRMHGSKGSPEPRRLMTASRLFATNSRMATSGVV